MIGARGVTTTYENRTHILRKAYNLGSGVGKMKIGIGIFAHNEEEHIRATLESLRMQDLLREVPSHGGTVEVTVVANGCRDGTVSAAREACGHLSTSLPGVSAEVAVLEKAGKSNAWNEFVHRFAAFDADYLVFMDADIKCVGGRTLSQIVAELQRTPEACVGVGRILKDIALKTQKSALEELSVAVSAVTRAGSPKIAGSLYAMHGSVARRTWLPCGLLVEDGFLKALLLTDGFTRPENYARIVRVDDAVHTFEAERCFLSIFRHEIRLTLGTAQNILLFKFLRNRLAGDRSEDLGGLIRRLNGEAPDWVSLLTQSGVKSRGWRMLPLEALWLPFKQLQSVCAASRHRYLFICLLRSAFNGMALIGAYFELKRGRLRW